MKYQNINPLEKLHEGEPFFFIRGQDVNAYHAVINYATLLKAQGDIKGSREVRAIADDIQDWQRLNDHLVKRPD